MTQALRKALVGAPASPLKLLGAITRDGGGAELAALLIRTSGLVVRLRGVSAPRDAAVLQAQVSAGQPLAPERLSSLGAGRGRATGARGASRDRPRSADPQENP